MIGWLYDLLSERSEKAGIEARRAELLAALEGDVLEIGVGTGRNLPHYERAGEWSRSNLTRAWPSASPSASQTRRSP